MRKLDRVDAAAQCRISAWIGRSGFDPQTDHGAFSRCELGIVVRAIDQCHQPAGRRADRARRPVAQLVPPVGNERIGKHGPIAGRVERRHVVRQVDSAVAPVGVVTPDTVTVQDGLDVTDEIEDIRHVVKRRDSAGLTAQGLQRRQVTEMRGTAAMLVTADAAGRLARLHRHEALHPLDGHVVFVQRDEKDRPHGRHLKIGRPVRLDRDRPQDALQREGTADGQRFLPAGEVGRFGQLLQHQQLLDLAAPETLHVPPFVNVRQKQVPGAFLGSGMVGTDRFAPARSEWPRLVSRQSIVTRIQLEHRLDTAAIIHHVDALVVGHQEQVFGQRIRIAEQPLADVTQHR